MYENHIKETIGHYKIQKVTPAILNDYFASRLNEAGLSHTSVKRHKALLHNVFNYALKENLVYSNPVERTTTIKEDTPEVKPLSLEEIKVLLYEARKVYETYKDKKENEYIPWVQYQMYAIIYTAINTGFRRGELLAIKWSDIDETENIINIRSSIVEVKGGAIEVPPKTLKSKRATPVEPEIIEALKEIKMDGCDYVFHTGDGKHLTPSNINRAFYRIRNKAGLKCRFHDLRHTHATWLINSGIDVKTVSERLGHSNISTTLNKYTHVINETQRKAAATMIGLLTAKEAEESNATTGTTIEPRNNA